MRIFKMIQSFLIKPGRQTDHLSLIIDRSIEEYTSKNQYYWWLKGKDFITFNNKVLTLTDKEKIAFITYCIHSIYKYYNQSNYLASRTEFMRAWVCEIFMDQLLKLQLQLEDEDIFQLINEFRKYPRQSWNQHITCWPLDLLLNQIEYQLTLRPSSLSLRNSLVFLNNEILREATSSQQKQQKAIFQKLYELQFKLNNTADIVQSKYFLIDDDFVNYANDLVKDLVEKEHSAWFKLMYHAENSQLEKPSAKFLSESKDLITALGIEKFHNIINNWLLYIIRNRKNEKRKSRHGTYTILLNPCNLNMLKGLVWMSGCYPQKETFRIISVLADKLLKRNNRKVYTISSLINACLYTLSRSATIDGISYLSDLNHRIREPELQSLIRQYLIEAAASRDLSVAELEDLAVQQFDLKNEEMSFVFPQFSAVIKIKGKAHAQLLWVDAAGHKQKHIPAAIKLECNPELKQLLQVFEDFSNSLQFVKDRFDRMFITQRVLSWSQFNDYYLSHKLVSFFTKKLIWCFQIENKTEVVIHINGQWINNKGSAFDPAGEQVLVSLWHPLNSHVNEIIQWRTFILAKKIIQPVQQAFRQVYLVAADEHLTMFYSNRMAANLILQQRFKMLTNLKGWSYAPLGNEHDGRYKEMAVLKMPDFHLKAEFCINEPAKENQSHGKHMWLYVGTDQLRFFNQHGERMQLPHVPKIAFSEVMKDIDFFIRETAIGKDLEWHDGIGNRGCKKNWQSYYFPEMSETIGPKRKLLLEGIIPRLKEKESMDIKDNILVVKGKLRTYYIDLKTTRIQMSPYNQSLCIQPVISPRADARVYLPFEGDYGISLILSQALLLAQDDKITDPVINRQIKIR